MNNKKIVIGLSIVLAFSVVCAYYKTFYATNAAQKVDINDLKIAPGFEKNLESGYFKSFETSQGVEYINYADKANIAKRMPLTKTPTFADATSSITKKDFKLGDVILITKIEFAYGDYAGIVVNYSHK